MDSKKKEFFIRLEEAKNYITVEGMYPSPTDSNTTVRKIGRWLATQRRYSNPRRFLMTDDDVYNAYNEFIDKYNAVKLAWYKKFEIAKEHCLHENKIKDEVHYWIIRQISNFYHRRGCMAHDDIYGTFGRFLEENKDYICIRGPRDSSDKIVKKWFRKLEFIKSYIEKHKTFPKHQLQWFIDQQSYFEKNIRIMLDDVVRVIFNNFLTEYKSYIPDKMNINFISL